MKLMEEIDKRIEGRVEWNTLEVNIGKAAA